MPVAVEQACYLCGQPTLSFEQKMHSECAARENMNVPLQQDYNDTCHLCGWPAQPFERGIHNDCSARENYRSDQ